MENLSKKAAALSPEQLELLKKKISEKVIKNKLETHKKIMPYKSRDGCYPLSGIQQGFWDDGIKSGNGLRSLDSITCMVMLKGRLDFESLEKSIITVSKRHKILNYVFRSNDNINVQAESQSPGLYIESADIEGKYLEKKVFAAERFIAEDLKNTSWNLEKGPLVMFRLLAAFDGEHYLLIKAHPLIFDVPSINVFLNDMACFYECYSTGKGSELEDLQVQYGDYACWQRELWSEGMYSKSLDYWGKKLDRMALCKPYSSEGTNTGANENTLGMVSLQILPDVLKELKLMCRREDVTLYTLLLTAFYCLLYKSDRQKEICIGTLAESRNSVELEKLIGPFENEIAFLINFTDNMNFRELLKNVRAEVLETCTYQDFPLAWAQTEPGGEKISLNSPVCRNMFLLNNETAFLRNSGDLTARVIYGDYWLNGKAVVFSLKETDQALVGTLKYNDNLLNEETIQRMKENYLYILEEVIKNPGIALSDLKISNYQQESYTEIEEKLITIWKEVLDCDRLGVTDNFFEIGGNSLRLVRMHEAIEKIYPGKLTIAKLFSYPTIAGLAAYIEGKVIDNSTEDMSVTVPLLPLPLDFFINGDEENEEIALKANICDEVWDKLQEVASDIGIEEIDALLAIYIYLLSETIGQQQITVQTMINGNELVYPLSINMENISDFGELFKKVSADRLNASESDTYPIKLAGSMQLNKTENSIMSMLTNQAVEKAEFLENYDIIMKIDDKSETISILCDYNSKRLRKEKVEELLSNYTNLIKILIERMI